MAAPKLVCGGCGGEIARGNSFCPSCGVRLEWDEEPPRETGRTSGDAAPEPAVAAPGPFPGATCTACGHRNTGTEQFCESCGVRLPGMPGPAPAPAPTGGPRGALRRKGEKPARKASGSPPARRRGAWRVEPWTAVMVVALLALVGFLVYTSITTEGGRGSGVPAALSSQGPKPSADIGALEQAVSANPDDPVAVLRLANGLQDNGMYPRAVDAYQRYLRTNPKDADARVDLGICFYEMGNADSLHARALYDRAEQDMKQALMDVPTHQAAAFNLGVVTLRRGELEESNSWFRRAVQISSTSDLGQKAQQMLKEHSFAK